ncbi:unnamed protein product [Prunus armeniaca]
MCINFNKKTKHINREALQEGVIDLRYSKSDKQIADTFTKALPRDRFNYLRGLQGVKPVDNVEGVKPVDNVEGKVKM